MALASADDARARRRRGPELEAALLDAAWRVLLDVGYDDLTFEAVAAAAGTSRAVLYRRWQTKPDLVRAAAVRALDRDPHPYPDTGSLRGDLLAAFEQLNGDRERIGLELETRLLAYFRETGAPLRGGRGRSSPAAARRSRMDAVLDRAVSRGEVDGRRLTPRVRRLPLDLFRAEVLKVLTTRSRVPREAIDSIVDEVLIPLLTRRT